MVDIPKPLNGDYMILETINTGKEMTRSIHVLIPSRFGDIFKLGRGHDTDIKVTDISVSRLHATITFTKKGFYIKDNRSKFGTLIQLQKKTSYSFTETPKLQIGRTRISATIKDENPSL